MTRVIHYIFNIKIKDFLLCQYVIYGPVRIILTSDFVFGQYGPARIILSPDFVFGQYNPHRSIYNILTS